MKKITQKKELELAQKFFELVWDRIEDGDDSIYEELDPECEYGDELCKLFNNDTILEVLRIGFREKFGQDLRCGKLTSEIEREDKEETPQVEKVKKPLALAVEGDMVVDAICRGICNVRELTIGERYDFFTRLLFGIRRSWEIIKMEAQKSKKTYKRS